MKTDPTEADCWFVIGAHQAGATEAQCAELAGLTRQATRKIISNFKHLGSPHASTVPSASVFMKSRSVKRKTADVNVEAPVKPQLLLNQPPTSNALKRKRGRPRIQVAHAEAETLIQQAIPHTEEEQSKDGWTEEDDRLLLVHVLKQHQNFKWKEAEDLFGTRHLGKICHDRWELLKKELVSNLKKR